MVSTSSMPTSATLFLRRYRWSNSFARPPKVPTTMSMGTLMAVSKLVKKETNFGVYLGPLTNNWYRPLANIEIESIPWPIGNLVSNVAPLENLHPHPHLITDRLQQSADLNSKAGVKQVSISRGGYFKPSVSRGGYFETRWGH